MVKLWKRQLRVTLKKVLSVFEYFISTYGARKGQADTALKTANSGYLTRRLVDVAQDVVITWMIAEHLDILKLKILKESGDIITPLSKRAYGRMLASDVKDPVTGELIFKQGQLLGRDDIARLADSAVSKLLVRSVLTCQAKRGVCARLLWL